MCATKLVKIIGILSYQDRLQYLQLITSEYSRLERKKDFQV
jgi:hypothetical protein